MDYDVKKSPAEQEGRTHAAFRKKGFLYVPSSFHGWMLLTASAAMLLHAVRYSGSDVLPISIVIGRSIPPLILYLWVARHSCRKAISSTSSSQ